MVSPSLGARLISCPIKVVRIHILSYSEEKVTRLSEYMWPSRQIPSLSTVLQTALDTSLTMPSLEELGTHNENGYSTEYLLWGANIAPNTEQW